MTHTPKNDTHPPKNDTTTPPQNDPPPQIWDIPGYPLPKEITFS